MSPESNTESNSNDRPKRKLSLKKGTGSNTPASEPLSQTGSPKPQSSSEPKPEESPAESASTLSPTEETPAKPIRMSFKKKAGADEPGKPQEDAQPKQDEAPKPSLGLKVQPVEPISPAKPPPLPKTVGAGTGKVPIDFASPPSTAQKRSDVAAPLIPGEDSKGARPPTPPPGMKIKKDDEPSAAMPKPSPTLPPPVLPATDLMSEVIEEKSGKNNKAKTIKSVFLASLILLFLVGGIAFLVTGVWGMIDDDKEAEATEVVETPKASPPAAESKEPKGIIGVTKKNIEIINEKSSTEAITDFAEALKPNNAQPAPAETAPVAEVVPVVAEVKPAKNVIKVNPAPKSKVIKRTGDPAVREWIQELRPSSIGRGMMILNGEKYRIGEIVNPQLQVRWIALDPQLGVLTFQDPYGVEYEKDF